MYSEEDSGLRHRLPDRSYDGQAFPNSDHHNVVHAQQHASAMRSSVHVMSVGDKGGDQLRFILEKLDQTINENTKYLRKLKEGSSHDVKDEDEEDTNFKPNQVEVQIKITFLRIIDVDTVNQSYKADIFLQAKWYEPELESLTEKMMTKKYCDALGELDNIKWQEYWDPKLVITNIDGEPDEDQIWHRAKMDLALKKPMMIFRRRFRCRLKENLELKNFPVDVQELTLQVSSDRTSSEVSLVEDRREISSVIKGGFTDVHEWQLYNHVVQSEDVEGYESGVKLVPNEVDSRYKHPKVELMCYVARRPGYFFWNVILIMLLINLLTFTSFAISPDKPQSRLGVTLTLLLTAVAFKFVVAQKLPTISYLTYLDIYVLGSMVFLCLQAVQNAVVSLYVSTEEAPSDQAKEFDFNYMIAMGCILAVFHIVFFITLGIKGIKERRKMRRMEAKYEKKKVKMGKLLRTRDSVFPEKTKPTVHHMSVSYDDSNGGSVPPWAAQKPGTQGSAGVYILPGTQYHHDQPAEEEKRRKKKKQKKESKHRVNDSETY